MNVKEVRELSNAELQSRVNELKEELYNLRFQKATGVLENPRQIKDVKKSIARIYTVLTERKMANAE